MSKEKVRLVGNEILVKGISKPLETALLYAFITPPNADKYIVEETLEPLSKYFDSDIILTIKEIERYIAVLILTKAGILADLEVWLFEKIQ